MSELADWFWPIISALFALLWLWTLTRCRKGRSKVQPSESQALLQRREAEDLQGVLTWRLSAYHSPL